MNYSDKQIDQIKEMIKSDIALFDDSISWVEKNLKYEEKNNLLLTIKNAKNTFRKIQNSINDKPVMAVFGASQVGKSYLIQNLLRSTGKPFVIRNDNRDYDFLKEINPPGVGAESTGVVTRFTADDSGDDSTYPIEVKLLSAKDILIIVCDTYFLDLKKIEHGYNSSEIDGRLRMLEGSHTPNNQEYLTELDVLEVKEYFQNHLDKHTLLFESLSGVRFFERVARIIDGYLPTQWADIFNFLWNKNSELTQLYKKLIDILTTLDFESKIDIQFKEVLRDGGRILDVSRLKEIFGSSDKTIVKKSTSTIEVKISDLSAVIKELVFRIPENLKEEKPFLKNSDLLDFPGARSRLGLEYDEIKNDSIPDMLLRGKVSYLFNKYSDEFNISNLLFCTNDTQSEVTELSSLLHNWISTNIGDTAERRTETLGQSEIPPLFIIYTFFNNQLKYDSTNDVDYKDYESLQYKWETRFIRFFRNEIVTQTRDWDTNWILTNRNFKNKYLLRDFKYSTDTYSGFEEQGIETEIRPERKDLLNSLRNSFVNYDFVLKHFANPEKSWDSATGVNQNGSNLIIENLSKVSNNYSKINYYINTINQVKNKVKTLLERYAHMDDFTRKRRQDMQKTNSFQFAFNGLLTKDKNAFNTFIEKLNVKPRNVFNLLNENMVLDTSEDKINILDNQQILLQQYPDLRKVNSYEEAVTILKKELWMETKEEVEEFFETENIDIRTLFNEEKTKTKSEFYVDLMMDTWQGYIQNPDNFGYFLANNIDESNIEFVTNHLIEIIESRQIRDKINQLASAIINEMDLHYGIEEFMAETFAIIINNFVSNFDVDYFQSDTIRELESLRNINFSERLNGPQITLEELFSNELIADSNTIMLEKYRTWLESFRASLIVHTGFADYDAGANEDLLRIINQFKTLKL